MPNNRRLRESLIDIHKNSRSGILRAQRESAKKQLVINLGKVALAESNLPEEHLARILVAKGILPRKAIGEIASLMKAGKTSEEAVLAVSNSDRNMLEQGRRDQAISILASLLAWDNCEVRFYPGENLIPCLADLGLPLPEIMVLSARSAVSSCLVTAPPDFFDGSFSISEEHDYPDLFLMLLDAAESCAYSLVRKSMPAKDLLPLIPAGEAKPEELLLRLFVLGLIRPDAAAPQPDKPAPADRESHPSVSQLEEMLLRLDSACAYEVLGVRKDADQEEIQRAYHNIARRFHPDRFQSREYSDDARTKAERIFACINESYSTLRDSASRALYDEKRLQDNRPLPAGARSGASGGRERERMAEGLFREGRNCLARGDFEQAVEHLKGSVWLCPDKPEYHRYLGIAQSEIPAFRKSAEQHFLKAIELDGVGTENRLALAKLYLKVNLPRKAEMQLRHVLRLDPENPEAGRLSAELKRYT